MSWLIALSKSFQQKLSRLLIPSWLLLITRAVSWSSSRRKRTGGLKKAVIWLDCSWQAFVVPCFKTKVQDKPICACATTSQPVKSGTLHPKATGRVLVFVLNQGEVLAWELESSLLAQRTLRLPAPLLEAPLTSLVCHPSGSLFVGDEQGAVWRLQVCKTTQVWSPASLLFTAFCMLLFCVSLCYCLVAFVRWMS